MAQTRFPKLTSAAKHLALSSVATKAKMPDSGLACNTAALNSELYSRMVWTADIPSSISQVLSIKAPDTHFLLFLPNWRDRTQENTDVISLYREASYFPVGLPPPAASNSTTTQLACPWAKPNVPGGQKQDFGPEKQDLLHVLETGGGMPMVGDNLPLIPRLREGWRNSIF